MVKLLTTYDPGRDWHIDVHSAIIQQMKVYGYDVKLISMADMLKVIDPTGFLDPKQCQRHIIFAHPDGQFYWIDFKDHVKGYTTNNVSQLPNCLRILKLQYRHWEEQGTLQTPINVVPYTYFVKAPNEYESRMDRLAKIPKDDRNMFWAGLRHCGRSRVLDKLVESGIIKILSKVNRLKFYELLARQRLHLSLPGAGNSCHREFECFGIKVPVIAPIFKNIYHNDLVPNYHYIASPNLRALESWDEVADALIERYNEVINDDEYLRFVAQNAYDWFMANSKLDSAGRLAIAIMQPQKHKYPLRGQSFANRVIELDREWERLTQESRGSG